MFDCSRYYKYEELKSIVLEWENVYPELASVYSIGKGHRERDLWMLEITSSMGPEADKKPGYFIDANTHPEELAGSTVALYIAWRLLSEYGKDEMITRLLDTRTFYILPRLNPDGAEIVMTTPFYEYIGNGRYLPGDEQVGPGLHYADINGDGVIVDMRIKDKNGEWKVSEKDPRLMIQRKPDEFGGEYYRIMPEGWIEEYDGAEIIIPKPRDGNLNRQYPYGWGPEGEEYGSGDYPLSEPEIEAVVRFHTAHPNIAGAIDYHTNAGIILPPTHIAGKPVPFADRSLFERIGKMGEEATGYPVLSSEESFSWPGMHPRMGTATDYLYGQLGIISCTVELWDIHKEAGIEKDWYFSLLRELSEEDNLKLLRWNDEKLNGEGFMPWTPFEHPQLGPVEIGGWGGGKRLYMFRNPPEGKYLEETCQKNAIFALRYAAVLPQVAIKDLRVTAESENTFKLEAIVVNEGFLPTNLTKRAIDVSAAQPVIVTLESESKIEFIVGQERVNLGNLEGRSEQNVPYSRFFDRGTPAKKVEWVVRVSDPKSCVVKVRAVSQKGGEDEREVSLC